MISKESGTRQAFGLFFSSPPQCLAVIYLLLYKCMLFFHMWKEINVMFICSVLIFFFIYPLICVFIHSLAFISGGLFVYFVHLFIIYCYLFIYLLMHSLYIDIFAHVCPLSIGQ